MYYEIRKDYFTSRMVIHSSLEDSEIYGPRPDGVCTLCPGNEEMTPRADIVLTEKSGSLLKLADTEGEVVRDWCVRVFPTRKPLVHPNPPKAFSDAPLYSEPAYGIHYVLVATPNHNETFPKMSIDQWTNVVAALQDKVRWLYGQKRVAYVAICIEQKKEAPVHPHAQIIAMPRLPPIIQEESDAVQRGLYEYGTCPMCTTINLEIGGPRQILKTECFIALAPWASISPYGFSIYPCKHQTSFTRTSQKEVRDFALILRSTLGGMANALDDPSFNLSFHLSSEKKTTKQIHWHVEVFPETNGFKGLERSCGIFVNSVPPEKAAELLGPSARRELAQLMGAL